MRNLLFGLVLIAVAVASFGTWAISGRENEPPHSNALLLDRPEVRAPACPTNSPMVWRNDFWEMNQGPVVMFFRHQGVGSKRQVFTGKFADGPKEKIPLHIKAEPGTPFTVRGVGYSNGLPVNWEGPSSMPTIERPMAEGFFIPGVMVFPEAGCYQVFVDIAGDTYGPFGFTVV